MRDIINLTSPEVSNVRHYGIAPLMVYNPDFVGGVPENEIRHYPPEPWVAQPVKPDLDLDDLTWYTLPITDSE